MRRSLDRICTTHVGSLARPPALLDLMRAAAEGQEVDPAELAQAGQADAETGRAEQVDEVPDAGRAAHRDHEDAFGVQVTPGLFGQSLHRGLVAHPLHQHHRARSRVAAGPRGRGE